MCTLDMSWDNLAPEAVNLLYNNLLEKGYTVEYISSELPAEEDDFAKASPNSKIKLTYTRFRVSWANPVD